MARIRGLRPRRQAGSSSMQRLDRALVDAVPSVGRYGWETVIVLER